MVELWRPEKEMSVSDPVAQPVSRAAFHAQDCAEFVLGALEASEGETLNSEK